MKKFLLDFQHMLNGAPWKWSQELFSPKYRAKNVRTKQWPNDLILVGLLRDSGPKNVFTKDSQGRLGLRGDVPQMTLIEQLSPHFVFEGCLRFKSKMFHHPNGCWRPSSPIISRKVTSKRFLIFRSTLHLSKGPCNGGCAACACCVTKPAVSFRLPLTSAIAL